MVRSPSSAALDDQALFDRQLATLRASWAAYAAGSPGAALRRGRGATIACFPAGPERQFYNNAILDRGRADDARVADPDEDGSLRELDVVRHDLHRTELVVGATVLSTPGGDAGHEVPILRATVG